MNVIPSKNPDYFFLFCVAFLVLFGLVMLSSASSNLGKNKFDNNYFYLKHQIIFGLIPGIAGYLLASRIYFGAYEKLALPILLAAILGILLVFTPLGLKAGGADRWLSLGAITFQPAESLKLAMIIYLAAWLNGSRERKLDAHKGFIPFLLLLFLIGAILLKQSSTSTFFIILLTSCVVYFASGARHRYLISIALFSIIALLAVSYFTPYRWKRIMTYVNPSANPETSGYHINQALTAIGSGGLTGVGLGQSTTKIKYLPEPIGDSIFAVVSEELGFIGSSAVIILFALLTTRTILLARKINHQFGQLLLIGFGSMVGIQAFVNIAAISGLIPLTGMPLPFISYGGTALAMYLTMSGIITNISKYARV